jgi:serine/threonine protein phosphatase 1
MTTDPRFLPGDIIAIGDIHGQFSLLVKMKELLKNTGVNIIFLGDLIDRAKDEDGDVLSVRLVRDLVENPEKHGLGWVESLKGNHEQMFLDAYNGWDVYTWFRNGGNPSALRDLGEHYDWIKERPYYRIVEETLFVHAGVFPNTPLNKQSLEDFIWIRQPFLTTDDLNIPGITRVVHGHTPNFDGEAVRKGQRIGIDTAAFDTGILTGYNLRSDEVFQVKA